MPTAEQTLQAELVGEERAIRHLIGEQAALSSRLKRDRARRKLDETRLHALQTRGHGAVGQGPALAHGERFPDTSSYQPNVDLKAVRNAGAIHCGQLAFSKITEGTGWTDAYGPTRFQEMQALEFQHRGGYHFLHASESPAEQATHFLDALHAHGSILATDVLVADVEVSDGQAARNVAACAREFGELLKKETPAHRWLYGGGPFLRANQVTLDGYDAHWLAAYAPDPAPYMVYGRGRTVAWQYTDGTYGPSPHACPGIGAGDLSIIL